MKAANFRGTGDNVVISKTIRKYGTHKDAIEKYGTADNFMKHLKKKRWY